MRTGIEFAHKISLAYSAMCKPLCHQINLPQTAFDILMFLSNNPEFTTARDIVEIRKIKANLVSVNVDRLVKEVEGDRRKHQLVCTPKADEIINMGLILQKNFVDRIFEDIDEETKDAIYSCISKMNSNLNEILEEVQ